MLSWDLDKRLRPMMQYLIDCRPHSVSMGNAYKVRTIFFVDGSLSTIPKVLELHSEKSWDVLRVLPPFSGSGP